MTENACPDCGASVLRSISGRSVVLSCSECAWAVATTNYERPEWDEKNYLVFLTATSDNLTRAAGRVAAELGVSGHEALQALRDGKPLNSTFTASDVIRFYGMLVPLGFTVATEPPFPWGFN